MFKILGCNCFSTFQNLETSLTSSTVPKLSETSKLLTNTIKYSKYLRRKTSKKIENLQKKLCCWFCTFLSSLIVQKGRTFYSFLSIFIDVPFIRNISDYYPMSLHSNLWVFTFFPHYNFLKHFKQGLKYQKYQ